MTTIAFEKKQTDYYQEKLLTAIEGVNSIIVGKPQQILLSFVCLLSGGHLLLEDLPGTGKTELAKALAGAIDLSFARIQMTPDLMPNDVLGVSIFQPQKQEFVLRKGPIFHNIILADEINRGSPRTQSALLEAMAEKQVSIDGETLPLPSPFMVIATQNPLDGIGTFPLPQAQKDRFLFCLSMDYPHPDQELLLMKGHRHNSMTKTLTAQDILFAKKDISQVKISESLYSYLHRLILATRHPDFDMGLSTRAALLYVEALKAYAFLQGRQFVLPEDVQEIFLPLARHRVVIKGGENTLKDLLQKVPVS